MLISKWMFLSRKSLSIMVASRSVLKSRNCLRGATCTALDARSFSRYTVDGAVISPSCISVFICSSTLLATCSSLLATCSSLLGTCSTLLATCSSLLATYSTLLAECKAHLNHFWSEFFEHSGKPRTAMQIFDVAIRWASVRVINFCSMQTLRALGELRFNFK